MSERLIRVEGGELCIESFGLDTDPAVLLIGGMAQSMDWWDVELCQLLADGGRFVTRYDHRDTGRSSSSPVGSPSYSANDLDSDPLRILDALGIGRAHLVGMSMGGGIAQELAARQPERLLTITLIATSPAGERVEQVTLPPPLPQLVDWLGVTDEPAWEDHAAVVDHLVESQRHFGPVEFDEDRVRAMASAQVDRTRDMAASVANHAAAEGSSEPFRLMDLAVPTLVLHGTADPLFPIAHGEALAAEIPGATFLALDRMGHEIPPPRLWPVVVPAILHHTATDPSPGA